MKTLIKVILITFAVATIDAFGADTRYPAEIEKNIGGKDYKLTLTGETLVKRSIFKLYTIASYVQADVNVHSAAEIVSKDCAKQLHLVMERQINGQDMAASFVDAISLNYPGPKFAEQKKQLLDFMKNQVLKKGDHVYLTHVPSVGFECVMPKGKILIKDVGFAQAIWEIYLGKINIGEEYKAALISKLKK